jgi:hypothetical protein
VDLGSRIFNDAENKGARVSGQLNGLEGTIVYLYADRNVDGIPDSTAIMSQTTNFAGDYLFTDLRPGTYLVEIVPPPGFVSSTGRQGWLTGPYEGPESPDPNAGPGGGINNDDNGDTRPDGRIFSKPMTLTSRQENALDSSLDPNTNRTLDFGVFKPLSLGNLVWDDLNDNGLLDNGETGIDGVVVNLYYDANFDSVVDGAELATPVTTTMTTNGGEYLFRHLGRGNYVVALAPSNFAGGGALVGYLSSDAVDAGTIGDYEPGPDPDDPVGPHNNPIDNDDNGQVSAAQSGGHEIVSKAVTLAADKAPTGEQPNNDLLTPDKNANLAVDFGVYLPFSLGNRVWFDVNNNGQQETGEAGIGDVLLNLYLSDGNTKLAYTYSDANGYYRFDNLRAGQYIVEIAPNNFITGTEAARGVLLNGKSSSSDEGDVNQNVDRHDNGAGNLVDVNSGVRSQIVQLGLGGIEPRNEADLAGGANPQGTQDNFANLTVDFGFYNIQPTALEETTEPHVSNGRVFIPQVRR